LQKSNGDQMKAADYAKGRENNAVRALKICRRRRMGTKTVPSAMEWRQPSQLPTTSSGDICMPACKLHKHQRVISGFVTPDKESSMSTLWRKSLSRYAAENCWQKRPHKFKKESLWKKTQHFVDLISTRQRFMKIVFGIKGWVAN